QSSASRERRRNRIRAPFGDEDIPIVFAGSGGRDLFHRRLASGRGTALVYDERMLLHKNVWFSSHAECPERVTSIIDRLNDYGLFDRCVSISAEAASDEVIVGCHQNSYLNTVSNTTTITDEERKSLASKLDSVYFNEVRSIP
ncbi:unnamed protein product, partial [Echinostoma caproni]|uniref:Hist_deacetyl domain-containing protein n=1 Tax=Echinostoma caproni TaxID=27848 RepID=A0A183BAB2_9TREM